MTGISFSIQLQGDGQNQLQGLLDRMDNRQGFFDAVGNRMVKSTSDNFRAQKAPDGTPWKPLRPATIRARERKKQLPLIILKSNSPGKIGSALAGSIRYIATNDEVQVGSPKEIAAIHQLGGVINKPARMAKIYRMKGADGTVGRRFVLKDKANHITDVAIPAHSITIPARPYLGVSPTDQTAIIEMAETWLLP